jgi:hypothetical protein
MVRAADTNPYRTVITSITLWTVDCITRMMAIAMTTGRSRWADFPLGGRPNQRRAEVAAVSPIASGSQHSTIANMSRRSADAVVTVRRFEAAAAGVKGLGELANVGTAAAISNAVYHATGIRVRKLPIRIEDVLEG